MIQYIKQQGRCGVILHSALLFCIGVVMKDISSLFGMMVFNDKVMRARLPKDIYNELVMTISTGKPLESYVADQVASAVKDWAIEKGATHYTHWFQPMTGITAEKHEGFIASDGHGGVIMEFSGKELIKGEPDASSFPSGGLRATFEARGYTAWDPTSYAFVKDTTLYIPTAFCSYSGEALDKKTPLLRSMAALDTQALRILRLFNNTTVNRVMTTVGPEQEYFLIDKDVFFKRPDLKCCGRTLIGARPPKGQELEDHYFGAIKPRVQAFMKELDEELWKLGIYAKTKHNEVAPSQHEFAPIFTTTNLATDHNQLTMELMKSIAGKHNLVCLLHEKPFAGVNGSGKHNNWSLITDCGINLLEPGDTPHENAQFLLFLTAVIKAVDEHQDLLRISVASAGNDHRLGANEAPPAIISMFLGEELTAILDSLENGNAYVGNGTQKMTIGSTPLPPFPKDSTDRNRTSPFAFTGNKFEFRMPGSSCSIAGPNVVLNTIVADALCEFADRLTNNNDFTATLNELIKETIKKHKRIVFNGNNYSDDWIMEAQKRQLLNLATTPEALAYFASKKNIELFTKHKVFSESEIRSRADILTENYCKIINIEAITMLNIIKRDIMPAAIRYEQVLTSAILNKSNISSSLPLDAENGILRKISSALKRLYYGIEELENRIVEAKTLDKLPVAAAFYRECVFMNMQELRVIVDELETLVGNTYWPLPTYADILYSV